ncbi:MAG: hypothetical protein ACK4M4_05295 [Flavobacterium sp.]
MKNSRVSLYFVFVFSSTIVLLNRYTSLHITDYRVHYFFDLIAATSFVFIVAHFFNKLQTSWSKIFTFILIAIAIATKAFLTWSADWKTQTILYQNKSDQNKTINLQFRADRFSFSHTKRVVQIQYILPCIEWTTDIDILTLDKAKWYKLNNTNDDTL